MTRAVLALHQEHRATSTTGPVKHYKIAGLHIAAAVPLRGVPERPAAPEDISILLAQTEPPSMAEAKTHELLPGIVMLHELGGDWWLEHAGRVLMRVRRDSMLVYRLRPMPDGELSVFLLGSGLGQVLQLRGTFSLHGSALWYRDRGVIVTGESGAGKSTTAMGLLRRGAALISDDLSPLRFPEKGGAEVLPGYPTMKLWGDALDRFGMPQGDLGRVLQGYNKWVLSARDFFTDEPRPVAAVFQIVPAEVERVEIEQMQGMDAFITYASQVYRAKTVQVLGLENAHFAFCSQLAETVPVYRISRPHNRWTVEAVLKAVEGVLQL